MRKQEYLHIHALLVDVARHLDEEDEIPPGGLAEYRALDTRPVSVRARKDEHREATMALATALGTCLEGEERPDVTVG